MSDVLSEVTYGLVIRPGDTLLLAVAGDLTMQQADEFRSEIRQHIGPEVGVVILSGVHQIAAYRPDPQPRPPVDFP